MKLELIEYIKLPNDEIIYSKSKFDKNILLIVIDLSLTLKIILFDFNTKEIDIKNFESKACNPVIFILNDFSIFKDDYYEIDEDNDLPHLTHVENFIIIDPKTLESKKIETINDNLKYSFPEQTKNEDYFLLESVNEKDKKKNILDIKNNKLIESFEPSEKEYVGFLYTKEGEKLYGLPYTSKESISYVNKFGEKKYYLPNNYNIYHLLDNHNEKLPHYM